MILQTVSAAGDSNQFMGRCSLQIRKQIHRFCLANLLLCVKNHLSPRFLPRSCSASFRLCLHAEVQILHSDSFLRRRDPKLPVFPHGIILVLPPLACKHAWRRTFDTVIILLEYNYDCPCHNQNGGRQNKYILGLPL